MTCVVGILHLMHTAKALEFQALLYSSINGKLVAAFVSIIVFYLYRCGKIIKILFPKNLNCFYAPFNYIQYFSILVLSLFFLFQKLFKGQNPAIALAVIHVYDGFFINRVFFSHFFVADTVIGYYDLLL